jgi:hypothetical protein
MQTGPDTHINKKKKKEEKKWECMLARHDWRRVFLFSAAAEVLSDQYFNSAVHLFP